MNQHQASSDFSRQSYEISLMKVVDIKYQGCQKELPAAMLQESRATSQKLKLANRINGCEVIVNYCHSKICMFDINFFLAMSGAATFLMLHRHLDSKILTSLNTVVKKKPCSKSNKTESLQIISPDEQTPADPC